MKKKIKNKLHISIYEEKNNTSLVGIIGIFIILVSMIGNNTSANANVLKTSLLEGKKITFQEHNLKKTLSIGKQSVIIGGQEFVIEITPKY